MWIKSLKARFSPDSAPAVSILTPFLNAERFIGEAVASVFCQTYRKWELLLIDDGSTDASTAFARRLASEMPGRVRYLHHPNRSNRGVSASRNLGLREAKGRHVAFLDADDVWLPVKLERQVDLLDRHPRVSMVYGPLVLWHGWTGKPEDELRNYVCRMGSKHDTVIPPPKMLIRQITSCDGLPGMCSMLVRRSVIEEVGGFDESFVMYEDEVFLSKIALSHSVYVMSESLDLYRQHPGSTCAAAVLSGDYEPDPNVPNKSRREYLKWLETYLKKGGNKHQLLTDALGVQIARYREAGLW